jgi:hypothetical protein
MTTVRLALASGITLVSIGCTPAYEFVVYNASSNDVSISLFSGRCVAKPGATCSVTGDEVPLDTPRGRLTFHPRAVGEDRLFPLSEPRSGEPFLVRLRFDGTSLSVVAPKAATWNALEPQPDGFPIMPLLSPRPVALATRAVQSP